MRGAASQAAESNLPNVAWTSGSDAVPVAPSSAVKRYTPGLKWLSRAPRRRASPKSAPERRLPMELQAGDRFTDVTGEYEVIGWPYTTNMGKNAHVRGKRVVTPRCR